MADHTKFVLLAQRLITKHGRDVTMQKMSAAAADSSKPWKGPAAPTLEATKAAKAAFLPPTGTDFSEIVEDESLLKRVEKVALVAYTDTDLTFYSAILDGANRWKIDWVQVLKPADQTLLYAFGVCR